MTQFSYSSLSGIKNCPRCFYYDRKLKVPQPQGIKSGMPAAVDKIIKEKFDVYRGQLPECLQGVPQLKGFVLYDGPELKKMRHWKSNPLKMQDAEGNTVVGAFDDLLFNPTTGVFAYLDYKSTGKEPDQEFGELYYAIQCDIYTDFLKVSGWKFADFGVLIFFWPSPQEGGLIEFKTKPIVLKAVPENAEILFKKAVDIIKAPTPPPSGEECEYCKFVALRHEMAVVA